jgi:hypothetical protein
MHINDELPPLIFDFRIASNWGYYDQSIPEVVFMKRWQVRMRHDMRDLFADEIKPNLYAVDQFFWENSWERKGRNISHQITVERILTDGYYRSDLMPLLSRIILYWAKNGDNIRTQIKNLWGENLTEEQRQQAYLGWYANANIPSRMINHGRIADDLLIYNEVRNQFDCQEKLFYYKGDFEDAAVEKDIRRMHAVTRKMIKWLASNEGQDFIHACERNMRIKYDREKVTRLPHTICDTPVQQWLSQRP